MRARIREALTRTESMSALPWKAKSEAIVEFMIAALHDRSIAWALREIIDRPE